MSISSVSSSYAAYQPGAAQNNLKQVRQDFQDLASALQAGDLSKARDAFAALQKLTQSMQPGTPSQSPADSKQNPFSTDLTAIGKALQSGDISAAQDALKKLQQDMQVAGQGHGHHHHADAAQGAGNSALTGTTGATDSDGDHDGSVGKVFHATA